MYDIVGSGKVTIRIDRRSPPEQAQQARRDREARKTTGCAILTP